MEEQQDKIVVGSTVRLRDIPGPLMRVIRIQNDHATCFWFNRSNEPHEDQFAIILLMKCAPYVHRPREESHGGQPTADDAAAERFERETAPVEVASADH